MSHKYVWVQKTTKRLIESGKYKNYKNALLKASLVFFKQNKEKMYKTSLIKLMKSPI